MARIRTVKPELSAHEGLFDLERETGLPIRFAWCMLFTVADREGRFVWRPRTLKAQILPHDDLDFSRVLDAWVTRGFVRKYRVGGEWYGWIPTFSKHQVINHRESASDLPPIEESDEEIQSHTDACATRAPRVNDASPCREGHASGEGKGRKEGRERNVASGRDVALQVLNFLNEKTGRDYQPVAANLDLIAARLKEGASVDDCRAVVAKKCRDWAGDEKMAEYLRPATLFNATKFAQYRGELGAKS